MTPAALRDQLRSWYPLALVFLAVGLSVSMSYPFLTLFLTDAVHADPVHVTIYLVAGPVAGVVLTQLIGQRTDRRPVRRRFLIGAAIAGVAAMSVNAFVRDYWLLLGVVVTLTAVAGSMLSQGFAYARTVLAGSDRAAMTTSTLRMLFSLAWVGGPPIAALIQSTAGFSALYATAAGMYAVALIVTFALLPEPTADPAKSVAAGHSGPPGTPGARPAGSGPPVRVIACTIMAFALLQGASRAGTQMLPLFLKADLHSGARQAGLILGLCAGLEIPLMLAFGAASTRLTSRRLIMIGPLLSGVYLLLASTATHTWALFASQLLNAASIAATQGLGISYVQDLMPRHPGRASALFTNSIPAGTVLSAPVILGAQAFGYRTGYLIAAGLCVAGFMLFVIGRPRSSSGKQKRTRAKFSTYNFGRKICAGHLSCFLDAGPGVPDHGGADGADGHAGRYQPHAGGQVEGSEERRCGGLCPQGGGDGSQQRLAQVRDAAADDDRARVNRQAEHPDRVSHPGGEAVTNGDSIRVPRSGDGEDGLRRERLAVGWPGSGQGGTGGAQLQAAALPASAERAIGVDGHVSDLTGRAAGAAPQ